MRVTPEQELTEDAVRMLATPEVFARGRDYYRQGMVLEMVTRGNQLHALVRGSDAEPYRITLTAEDGRITQFDCTCPYEWGGACKHIVAVLLAYFQEPERVEKRPGLEAALAPLDRDRLQTLLLELAEREPDLLDWIEIRALALQGASASPTGAAQARPALPPVDAAAVQQQIRAALRPRRRSRYYDEWPGEAALSELTRTVDRARAYLAAGDGAGALALLDVAAEELTTNIELLLGDEGTEVGFLCEELGSLLAEAFLTIELTAKERQGWADTVSTWEECAGEYGYEEALQVARYAALQGWDYPPLQRVLKGEITDQGAWEGAAPDCADDLAVVRLKILERQERWEEYLHLAEAEGQTELYVTMLVRLGRIEQAVQYGLTCLASRGEALALSRALEKAGAAEEALQVAEHALVAFDAGPYPNPELPRWTRDLAARLQQKERALPAALLAMREGTTLADYLAVQSLAGDQWPRLREELLEQVRRRQSHYPSDEIDIFLHEGLIEDAIAAADASPRHELVERVAEAALSTNPDWVVQACTHQFDRIADAGKSQYYVEAAQWLEKAREAMVAAGREAEWGPYLEEKIARHRRKYNLRPLLEQLR